MTKLLMAEAGLDERKWAPYAPCLVFLGPNAASVSNCGHFLQGILGRRETYSTVFVHSQNVHPVLYNLSPIKLQYLYFYCSYYRI